MRTCGKLVKFRFDSIPTSGFQVSIEIGPQGELPTAAMQGVLTFDAQMSQNLSQWRDTYRSQMGTTRLKSGQVIRNASLNSLLNCSSADALQEIEDNARKLEVCFGNWITSPEFKPIQQFIETELKQEKDVQVTIQTDDPNLHHLPWHTWNLIDKHHQAEIVLSPSSFRRVPLQRSRKENKKVSILVVFGCNEGIDLSEDETCLNQLQIDKRDDVDLTVIHQPSVEWLRMCLRHKPWDIFFFAGHSETFRSEALKDEGRIYLNHVDSIPLSDLKQDLESAITRGLQLAIFNSCDGLGFAKSLEELRIPQMIVMREPIPDQVAQAFLEHFLNAFSTGEPFHIAVRSAREKLKGLEKKFPCATWLPIIFQNPGEVSPRWEDLRDYALSQDTKDIETSADDREYFATLLRYGRNPGSSEQETLEKALKGVTVTDRITRQRTGQVMFSGGFWKAKLLNPNAPDAPMSLDPGDRVNILGRDGNTLLVAPGLVAPGLVTAIDIDTVAQPATVEQAAADIQPQTNLQTQLASPGPQQNYLQQDSRLNTFVYRILLMFGFVMMGVVAGVASFSFNVLIPDIFSSIQNAQDAPTVPSAQP